MKKSLIICSSLVAVIIVMLLLIIHPWSKTPFKYLSSNDISSVSVRLSPPDQVFDLSNDEIIELTKILNSVVIYNKDNSYNQYCGQAVIYPITKTDGTTLTVSSFNPFLIIDDTGYKAKYEPCEKLNALGNRIIGGE